MYLNKVHSEPPLNIYIYNIGKHVPDHEYVIKYMLLSMRERKGCNG